MMLLDCLLDFVYHLSSCIRCRITQIRDTQRADMANDISITHPKVILLSTGICATGLLAFTLSRRFARVKTPLDMTPSMFGRRMPGKVTRVGDGDNFRFYHTPGGVFLGWGWLRHVPTAPKELKDQTLSIRIAGVDAPERLHFGHPAQPYSEEALIWLKNYLTGRRVTIIPYSIDQYHRVVARALVWTWLGRKDVGEQMLRNGTAVVYEAKTGAEFGGMERVYRRVEARAKRQHRGLWGLGVHVSPGEYKRVNYHGESPK